MNQYSFEAYSTLNTGSNSTPRYMRYQPLTNRSNISSQYTIRHRVNPDSYRIQRWKAEPSVIDNEVELMKIKQDFELLKHKLSKLNSILLPKDHQMTSRSIYELNYSMNNIEDKRRDQQQLQHQPYLAYQTGTRQKFTPQVQLQYRGNIRDDNSDSCNLSDIANDLIDVMDGDNKRNDYDYNEEEKGIKNEDHSRSRKNDGFNKYSKASYDDKTERLQSLKKGKMMSADKASVDDNLNMGIYNDLNNDIYNEQEKNKMKLKGKKILKKDENIKDNNYDQVYIEDNDLEQNAEINDRLKSYKQRVGMISANDDCLDKQKEQNEDNCILNTKNSVENPNSNKDQLGLNNEEMIKSKEKENNINLRKDNKEGSINNKNYEINDAEKDKVIASQRQNEEAKIEGNDINDNNKNEENEEGDNNEEAEEGEAENEEEEAEAEEGEEGEVEEGEGEVEEGEENVEEDNNEENNASNEQEQLIPNKDENIPASVNDKTKSKENDINMNNENGLSLQNVISLNKAITSEDEEEMILSSIILNAKEKEERAKREKEADSALSSKKETPSKPKKNVQFADKSLITISYNEKEKVTQLTLFDADGENVKFKARNMNRYITLLSSAKPKAIILNSPSSNQEIALETLNNLINEEKEEEIKQIPTSNSKNSLFSNNTEIIQRNILKCQEIQNNKKQGAKTFWRIKEKHYAKKIIKRNCNKFEQNPQKFFTEDLCKTVLDSYDIKTCNSNRTKSYSPSKVQCFSTTEKKTNNTHINNNSKPKAKPQINKDSKKPVSYIQNLKEMVENVKIEMINEEEEEVEPPKEESNKRRLSL